MKLMIVFSILLVVVFSVSVFLPIERVAELEKSMYYAVGIAGDSRFYLQKETESIADMLSAGNPSSQDETDFTYEGSIFEAEKGAVTFLPKEMSPDLADRITRKLPSDSEITYKDFAFADDFPCLSEPLTDEEVAFVFAQIVAFAYLSFPIKGQLTEISFFKNGDSLRLFSRIEVGLTLLEQARKIEKMPEMITFSASMIMNVKNSYISVNSDNISLHCESVDLPESSLIFGCNLAFGKKDYKSLFAEAVGKVFVNAGIYS